ncbi:hypothetical protein NOVOSPHI9U_210046 [Novosphingobium sp. 9U]|nr:hypothetical protein NOVOSPHI9U_210046 [Novosphingobium sp. 9U]
MGHAGINMRNDRSARCCSTLDKRHCPVPLILVGGSVSQGGDVEDAMTAFRGQDADQGTPLSPVYQSPVSR